MTPNLRFAVFTTWPQRCVWCTEPIVFTQMEVDHLIPKHLTGDDLARVVALHGLSPTYDLEAEENLAPSCRSCNGSLKGKRIPPHTPAVGLLLAKAAELAGDVRRRARVSADQAKVGKLIGEILTAADLTDPEVAQSVRSSLKDLLAVVDAATPSPTSIGLTPDVSLARDEDGTWAFTGFGDCPNDNCYTGDLSWYDVPSDPGQSAVGICYVCGTEAITCPNCQSVTGLFFDSLHCSGCGAPLSVERDHDSRDVVEILNEP